MAILFVLVMLMMMIGVMGVGVRIAFRSLDGDVLVEGFAIRGNVNRDYLGGMVIMSTHWDRYRDGNFGGAQINKRFKRLNHN